MRDADKATTDMEREAQAVQRLERLRRIRLIEDTFASGHFARFDPARFRKKEVLKRLQASHPIKRKKLRMMPGSEAEEKHK